MRCKNCGYENDDKLFICENCGSPLYDENEPIIDAENDDTQVFDTSTINTVDNDFVPADKPAPAQNNDDDDKKKKQTILIVVLVVLLVVVIAGVVFGIVKSSKSNDATTTTKPSTTTSQSTTVAPETTESTTKKQETTTQPTFAVGVSCNAGGSVSGDGIYKLGDNVTVKATVDNGYEFDGWYIGSKKVSTNTKYTFTVTESVSIKAVFKIVETTTEEPSEEPTVEIDNGADD